MPAESGLHTHRSHDGLHARAEAEEAQVQRAMIACAGEVVALAASDKLGTAGPYVIGPLSELNLIITDAGISAEKLEVYKKLGVEVEQV